MRRFKKVEKRGTRGPYIFTRRERAMFGKAVTVAFRPREEKNEMKPVTVLFRPWEDNDPSEAAPSSLLTVPQTLNVDEGMGSNPAPNQEQILESCREEEGGEDWKEKLKRKGRKVVKVVVKVGKSYTNYNFISNYVI